MTIQVCKHCSHFIFDKNRDFMLGKVNYTHVTSGISSCKWPGVSEVYSTTFAEPVSVPYLTVVDNRFVSYRGN